MSAHALTHFLYDEVEGPWPFVLREDASVDLGLGLTGQHKFVDRGRHIASLDGDILTIKKGYASDGASPYFGKLFGLRIGTPSHERTAPGWFTHDLLYQIAEVRCCVSWTYEDADDILHDLMRENGSRLGGLYHAGVALFGGMHRRFRRGPSGAVICITNHRMR